MHVKQSNEILPRGFCSPIDNFLEEVTPSLVVSFLTDKNEPIVIHMSLASAFRTQVVTNLLYVSVWIVYEIFLFNLSYGHQTLFCNLKLKLSHIMTNMRSLQMPKSNLVIKSHMNILQLCLHHFRQRQIGYDFFQDTIRKIFLQTWEKLKLP